jgi:cytochrome c-type biogenesis protein
VLAAILFTAAGEETVGRGMVLLLVYGLGMTLPFVLAALFIGPFMRWMRGFRRWLPAVEKAMGVLLIAFAVLIGTNTINWIANWMLEAAPDLWLLL